MQNARSHEAIVRFYEKLYDQMLLYYRSVIATDAFASLKLTFDSAGQVASDWWRSLTPAGYVSTMCIITVTAYFVVWRSRMKTYY